MFTGTSDESTCNCNLRLRDANSLLESASKIHRVNAYLFVKWHGRNMVDLEAADFHDIWIEDVTDRTALADVLELCADAVEKL